MKPDFGETLKKATIQFFVGIGYFLFALPFSMWSKSLYKLAEQYENGTLRYCNIESPYPFFVYLKRLFFDFLFYALTFITYPVAIIVMLVIAINGNFAFGLLVLIGCYYLPIAFVYTRDCLMLFVVMPVRKFLSWLVKPAQYLDLTIDNKK